TDVRTAPSTTGSTKRDAKQRRKPACSVIPMTAALHPAARLSVIGAGSYGTALAALCSARVPTMIWARNPAVAQEIHHDHRSSAYLPDILLPLALQATDSIPQSVTHAYGNDEGPAVFILGVPVAALAETCRALAALLPATRQHPVY